MNNVFDADTLLSGEQLSVSDLERSNARDIWVANTSHGKSCGAVAFQCASDSGPAVHIEVPYTFVAINLADQASPEIILRSESFRRTIARRFLTLVTEEKAREMNSGSQAQEELEKIRRGISVGVAESINTLTGQSEGIDANKRFQASLGNTQVHTAQAGLESNSYDPELVVDRRIVAIMNNTELQGEEKVNQLRTHRKLIKLVDAFYISSMGNIGDEDEVIEAGKSIVKALKKRAQTRNDAEDFIKKSRQAAQNTIRG